MITDFMKTIDVYGSPYNFTIFSQPTYKTVIGGVATAITFLLYIFCFFQFGTDFWMRQNPHYLNQKITLLSYPKYLLNRNDLMIGFRVEDIDGNYLNVSNLMNISIVYYKYELKGDTLIPSISSLDLIKCSLLDKDAMKMSTNRDLSNIMCLDFKNTTLGGYWDGDFLNYISVNFRACVNSSENNNICMDYSEANNYLSKGSLSFKIYTGSYFTDLDDYSNPLKIKLFNQYTYIDPDKGKNLRLFYKVANMTTDHGMVTSIPKKYSILGLDYIVTDTIPINPPLLNATSQTNLCSFEIYLLNNIETFNVSYIKLQEILATIGGLLNIISMVFNIFIGFINEHYRNIEIINNLFDFTELKDEEKLEKIIKEFSQNKMNFNKNKTINNDTKNSKHIINNDSSRVTHIKYMENDADNNASYLNIKPFSNNITNLQVFINKDVINVKNKNDGSQISNDDNSYKKQLTLVIPKPDDIKLQEIEYILNNNDVKSIVNKNLNDDSLYKNHQGLMIKKPDDSKLKEIEDITFNNIKDYIKKYEKSTVHFEVGFCLKFRNMICPKSLSQRESFYIKLMNRSLEIIDNKMDMINYLKFVQEYIHVKCLLFEDLQSLCLGFIKKPKIFETNRFVTINSKSHKQIKEIIQFFKDKPELTKKDLQIYDLLSDEIKLMIYKFRENK